MSFSRPLNNHAYPLAFWRWPRLLVLVHAWNSLVLQRNWRVNRQLRLLLPRLPADGLVVDAGCGDGQHIFPFAQKYPRLRFWGIDKNPDNTTFCRLYARALLGTGQGRLRFFHQELEALDLQQAADLLLCVGTLQYLADDERVLRLFASALKPSGLLLLYAPVNGRSVLPFYPYFFKKAHHYEKAQHRRRVYAEKELLGKITGAGFHIEKTAFNYGPLGIVGHEAYSLLLMGLGQASPYWAILFLPLTAIALPFLLALKFFDFLIKKDTGNGLMVLARLESG